MIRLGASPIEGRGAFASEPVSRGSIVHLLAGDRLDIVRCGWRIVRKRLRWDDPLQVGRLSYLALDEVSVAFNHSCDPTCGLRGDGELFALRDIGVGEELTYDYSLTVRPNPFTRSWRLACRCGASRCRGEVGNLSTVPDDVLKAYVAAGALQRHAMPLARAQLRRN